MKKKRLRSGFTTGSCAAAAAKAAALVLTTGSCPASIEIPFPDGSRKSFEVHAWQADEQSAQASIIKDAGDDPDVTNRAEIRASVSFTLRPAPCPDCVATPRLQLCRGEGVGIVTKPGLAVAVGEPAINPVPRQMIEQAVREVIADDSVRVTVSIENGAELAERTLNSRLGIVGGLSILGTTGIVRPISADAWTATIQASLDVAKEAGLSDIVLSTGRTSEKGIQNLLNLPEEAYAMMGDYLAFSLEESEKRKFTTLHLGGMWAKIMKAALRVPQTHVRNGALEVADAAALLAQLGCGASLVEKCHKANTAREIYSILEAEGQDQIIRAVCLRARDYCQEIFSGTVKIYLVDHQAKVLLHV